MSELKQRLKEGEEMSHAKKKPHKVAPDLWFDVGACKTDTDLREMVLFLFTLVSHWRFLRMCGMVYCIEDSQERQDRCWGDRWDSAVTQGSLAR